MNASQQPPDQSLLFGGTEPAQPRPGSVRSAKANGYAARPGSGPEGQTCGTCANCAVRELANRHVFKCRLLVRSWSACRSTDVLKSSPACKHWQQGEGEPKPTSIRTTTPPTWRD